SVPIPLKSFLQLLTSSNVPISRALGIAGKVYKQFNTPEKLGQLTDSTLVGLGISDKDDRKGVLDAMSAAGYRAQAISIAGQVERRKRKAGRTHTDGAGFAKKEDSLSTSPRKKRKVRDDKNEFFAGRPFDEGDILDSLEFNEILDEEALYGKSTIVNRAPIMMAWSYIVAERMGFQREDAFSIAAVYTEMNAITKGVSLGMYKKNSEKGLEASPNGAQPYVQLMGRRIPLFQTSEDRWRALDAEAKPASPAAAFSYVSRTLKQTAPAIVGAMRLLADSFSPEELNRVGWSLYADFRPEVDGWGKRGQVRCDKILSLRDEAKTQAAER
ncbi:hypothetical protein K488DRAFT_11188, partial [Vararia minispora EC-137]